MPRRSILSAAERESLLVLPDSKDDLIRHYTLSDTDLSIIRQRRGPANRLGFAVQLGLVRDLGLSAIVVTHDLAVARLLSTRLMVMRHGKVIEQGLTDQVLEDPQAAYSQLLVSSVLQV